jgi:hypothetical protein
MSALGRYPSAELYDSDGAGTQKLKPGAPKEGTGVAGLFGTIQRTLGSITQSKSSPAKSGAKDARTVRTSLQASIQILCTLTQQFEHPAST